jgi:hypothetical protein
MQLLLGREFVNISPCGPQQPGLYPVRVEIWLKLICCERKTEVRLSSNPSRRNQQRISSRSDIFLPEASFVPRLHNFPGSTPPRVLPPQRPASREPRAAAPLFPQKPPHARERESSAAHRRRFPFPFPLRLLPIPSHSPDSGRRWVVSVPAPGLDWSWEARTAHPRPLEP